MGVARAVHAEFPLRECVCWGYEGCGTRTREIANTGGGLTPKDAAVYHVNSDLVLTADLVEWNLPWRTLLQL
jgi:hypothetical protein